MDIPETLATLSMQNTGRGERNKTQKNKNQSFVTNHITSTINTYFFFLIVEVQNCIHIVITLCSYYKKNPHLISLTWWTSVSVIVENIITQVFKSETDCIKDIIYLAYPIEHIMYNWNIPCTRETFKCCIWCIIRLQAETHTFRYFYEKFTKSNSSFYNNSTCINKQLLLSAKIIGIALNIQYKFV